MAAKPILLPMIRGEAVDLSSAQTATIRAWAAMTGVMLHYSARNAADVGVDESRRVHLFKYGAPAPMTRISLVRVATSEIKTVVQSSYARRLAESWPMLYAELLTVGSLGLLIFQGLLEDWQQRILETAGNLVHLSRIPTLGSSDAWPTGEMTVSELLALFERVMPEAEALPNRDV
ncbi:MAG: hypothetical protein ACRDHU_00895 [Actinomycetota bacterium]